MAVVVSPDVLAFICLQCEEHGIPLPTVEEVNRKAEEIGNAKHYMYNEEDVDKVRHI